MFYFGWRRHNQDGLHCVLWIKLRASTTCNPPNKFDSPICCLQNIGTEADAQMRTQPGLVRHQSPPSPTKSGIYHSEIERKQQFWWITHQSFSSQLSPSKTGHPPTWDNYKIKTILRMAPIASVFSFWSVLDRTTFFKSLFICSLPSCWFLNK